MQFEENMKKKYKGYNAKTNNNLWYVTNCNKIAKLFTPQTVRLPYYFKRRIIFIIETMRTEIFIRLILTY